MSSSSTKLNLDHFMGINTFPKSVLFHPNGVNYIYTAGAAVVIGDLTNPFSQKLLSRHDDVVTSVALSSSGRYIASGQRGSNSNVYVWNFDTREIIYSLEEHDHMIQDLSFSPDEKMLVSIGNSDDGKIICWDLSNGYIIASSGRLPKGTRCVINSGYRKDIKRRDTSQYLICTGGAEGMCAWILDPFQGTFEPEKIIFEGRQNIARCVTCIDFSPDRELIYGSTLSGDFLLASSKQLRIITAIVATRMEISSVVSLRSATVLGCADGTVKYFSIGENACLGEIKLDGPVISLCRSVDQLELLALTNNGTTYRINVSNRQFMIISENHTQAVVAVAFSGSDNERIATASHDRTIRVWDLSDFGVIATAHARREQERDAKPQCLSFSDILISGWSDGKVLAHSPDNGDTLWSVDNAHIGGVSALSLSHNRRFLLTGGEQGEVRLWELRTRELISHLKEHVQRVTTLALFDDDTMAVSGSRDRCILRWDLRSEKRVYCHMQRMGGINSCVLSQDERYGLSVGQEKKITYWDNGAEQPVHSLYLEEETDEGRCIVMSHDGKYFATGGSACIVRLWDYDSAKVLSIGCGHSAPITSIAFSPDDKQIVSVGEDGGVYVWSFDQLAGGGGGGAGAGRK